MTKTSQWAGYVTSVLVIVFFVTAAVFRASGGDVPPWFPYMMMAILGATTTSAVVCLVTALFGFLRRQRQAKQVSPVLEPPHKGVHF